MPNLRIGSSQKARSIDCFEVLRMVHRKTLKHELLFYSLIVVLFLLGTFLGNQTVTTISEKIPIARMHRIVIDPGHGGEDGGAISCTGKKESGFNLQISLIMNDFFHLLGYETIMIRTSDTSVYTAGQTIAQKKVSDLKQRVRIVEQTQNAILLSIHQNTFPESKYSGAQVFYAASPGSEVLAKRLQEALVSNLSPGSSRKAKQGRDIYLLERVRAPGVLVECGFLSNPQEEAKLSTAAYQKKLCAVVATTLAQSLASG